MLVCAVTGVATAQDEFKLEKGDWKKKTVVDPASPEGELQAVRRAIAEQQPKKATKLADAWIKKHARHGSMVEARFLKAEALYAWGRFFEALYDYEHVIRYYAATEYFHRALEREFVIAKSFVEGRERRLFGMRFRLGGFRWLPAEGEGEELLIRIQERSPGSELGEKASLLLGDQYFKRAQMLNAIDAYDLFLINYPRSVHREHVILKLIRAHLATFKGPRFDPTGLVEASQRIKQYKSEYPANAQKMGLDSILIRIEESIARKELFTADWYERTGQKVSAKYIHERVLRDHPQSAAAQEALRKLKGEKNRKAPGE